MAIVGVKSAVVETAQVHSATLENGFQPGTSLNHGAAYPTTNVPVITQPPPGSVPPSYSGHIVLAIVALVAAFPFGLTALLLAGKCISLTLWIVLQTSVAKQLNEEDALNNSAFSMNRQP